MVYAARTEGELYTVQCESQSAIGEEQASLLCRLLKLSQGWVKLHRVNLKSSKLRKTNFHINPKLISADDRILPRRVFKEMLMKFYMKC